jgi:beta-glucanase (GH16 family)
MNPSIRRAGLPALLAVSALALSPAAAQAQTWTLVWSDEANFAANTAPDSSKWAYDNPTAGSSNAEWQIYCGSSGAGRSGNCSNWLQNANYDGAGSLRITALPVNGQWTSARLFTHGKFTFTYGKVEARIRMPFGAGLWPAFWLLGANIMTGTPWPNCGELDVMESVPSLGANRTRASLHGPGFSGGSSLHGDYVFPGGGRVDTAFHTYGMIWRANQVQYYVDGVTFATFNSSQVASWPFNNNPAMLILNLAVGGTWPGPPDGSTPNPARMYVDYVRVYREGASATPTARPRATPRPGARATPTTAPGGQTIANGTYRIIARHSGKALDVAGNGTGDGTNVHQWSYVSGLNQRWNVTHLGSGQYQIQSVSANKALDVSGAGTANGTNVQIWTYGGGNNQRWTIASVGSGYYRVSPVHAPALALDVSGPSTADGANVHVWTYGGGTNQQWSFLAP